MKYRQRLEEIWQKAKDNKDLPDFVCENRYDYCPISGQRDILFLGIAPRVSSRPLPNASLEDLIQLQKNRKHCLMHFDRRNTLLLSDDLDTKEYLKSTNQYLDLFYYRVDTILKPKLGCFLDNLDGRMFLEDQLQLTQQRIEQIVKPKIIIANSWQAASFLGIYGDKCDSDWMGYSARYVESIAGKHSVYQITGVNKQVRETGFFSKDTCLVGTFVICYDVLLENVEQFKGHNISADQLMHYIEVAYLDKYLHYNRSGPLSVDTVLQYPWMVEAVTSQRDNDNLSSFLKDFEFFKIAKPNETANYIFNKLSEIKILQVTDLKELQDESYCKKVFKSPREILLKITFADAKIIEDHFRLYKRQFFILNTRWTSKSIVYLVKWYYFKIMQK